MASIGDLAKYRQSDDDAVEVYQLWNGGKPTPDCVLLAADQTLGNCALVLLQVSDGAVSVLWATTLRTQPPSKTGHAGTLERSVELQSLILNTIPEAFADLPHPTLLAYETPPKGKLVQRPESSLLAAHCLLFVCDMMGWTNVTVGSQKAKSHICGNHRAEKAEAHAALAQKYQPLIEGYEKITNADLRDALMVGLTYLGA